jgi:hypothetical protein
MTRPLIRACALLLLIAGCNGGPKQGAVQDCTQSGSCPQGLRCFPDWHCYPADADPTCNPACYGAEPFCDKSTLRCAACLADTDCGAGTVCTPGVLRCQPGCSAAHAVCATAAEHCDLSLGVCRGCNADLECTDAKSPRCDVGSGRCVPCLVEKDNCPAGQRCFGAGGSQTCAPGCASTSDCTDGGSPTADCCDHRCVDTATDGQHCGVCGTSCGSKTCCAGLCADLASDVDHCGTCGRSCALPNAAGPRCLAGQCSPLMCESYFGNCDGDAANGCETNLSYTANHCATCGHVCSPFPHAAPACVLTACALGACDPGWDDCNKNPSDGCEVNLATEPANCGACLHACTALQSCINGQCF